MDQLRLPPEADHTVLRHRAHQSPQLQALERAENTSGKGRRRFLRQLARLVHETKSAWQRTNDILFPVVPVANREQNKHPKCSLFGESVRGTVHL